MGSVAYPEMKKYNYADKLTCPTITAGSSLSVLIPPSMWLIVYGSATETSVGKLFLAGVPAGILLLLIYLLITKVLVTANPKLAPVSPKATWKERWHALRSGGLIEVIIVFALSMGGMFIGWFTPTEAGAVGAAGMLLVTVIQKKMNWKKLKMAMKDTVRLTGMIYLILAGATVYGRFFAISTIPIALGNFVRGLNMPGWGVLLVIVLIYLILGCFVDGVPILLLTIPIFYPIICQTYGYDPVWYGILIVIVLEMGGITPPVGINHFILKGVVKDVPLSTMFSGIWPFAVGSLIACIVIIIFPILVTFLPALVFG
jgi:tripartite ATP-independent transporter DctM subunit